VTWDKKDNSDFISTNSRVKWDKLDKTLYEENLCEKLQSYTCMENLDASNVDNFVEDLCSNMVETTSELQPHKPRPKSKNVNLGQKKLHKQLKLENFTIKSGEVKVVLDVKTMNLL